MAPSSIARGEIRGPLKTILTALEKHRGHSEFFSPGFTLACDIVIPSKKLIIEYDERQHFSKPRAISLELYPSDLQSDFDGTEWIRYCNEIKAKDPDPPYRDEQRAFYDSVRDILAAENGFRLVRLKHGQFDWEHSNPCNEIPLLQTKDHGSCPRLVTVCVKGEKSTKYRERSRRLALLSDITRRVNQKWSNLDAIVFPGGFLFMDRPIGQLSYDKRKKALEDAGLIDPIRQAISKCNMSPRILVIIGVDGPNYPNGDGGDQMCVAVGENGIEGICRKIFPTEDEGHHLLCFDQDFSEAHRVIKLPCGQRAFMSACYDMFGIAESALNYKKRAKMIQHIGTYERQLNRENEDFEARLNANLSALSNLLAGVSVGIAAIHQFFDSDGRIATAFWQRHGIATASSALHGGIAVGAAHLTKFPNSPHSSTLASAGVPRTHLSQGLHREAHRLAPHDVLNLTGEEALVRLYHP